MEPREFHSSKPSLPFLILSWVAQVAVAIILLQTLYFKFTYAPETSYIFESRGGRPAATLVGSLELIAAALLLIPRRATIGAGLALGLIGGAIFTHLASLGIEVKNPETGEGDGGLLFGLAISVAIGSMLVLFIRRREIPVLGRRFERLPVRAAVSNASGDSGGRP